MYIFSHHQEKQVELINEIERQIQRNEMRFSTVPAVEDYDNDDRLCLTGIHLPKDDFIKKVQTDIIAPLKGIAPEHYYYEPPSLHLTIKSVRVINNPPHFTEEEIRKAEKVFAEVVPQHKRFSVYFYRFLLFPTNLALVGTTDPELDMIHQGLDQKLSAAGVPDDKIYTNKQYFFANMTLCRFRALPNNEFQEKIADLSRSLKIPSYVVDSVSLLICNAVLKKKRLIGSWKLQYES